MDVKALNWAARKHGVVGRSFKIALVVGILLNLINQPNLFMGICSLNQSLLTNVNWLKIILTYSMPFFVSLYGVVSVMEASFQNHQNPND
jgi:hypothetical protein